MSATNFPQAPGVYTGRSVGPRNIFASGLPVFYPSFKFLDGTKTRDASNSDSTALVQAGTVLGKITSGGKYRNTIIGYNSAAYTSGGTSLTVPAAVATEIARLIAVAGASISLKIIGPPSAAGTVASTSTTCSAASGTTLTVTDLGVNKAAGAIVAPADGAEAPSQFITNQYGVPVTDINGSSIDAPMQLLRNADIDVTYIPFYSNLDTSTQTWLKTNLRTNNAGAVLTFSDDR